MSDESSPGVQIPEAPAAHAQLQSGAFPDPWTTSIDELDVSDSRLYQQDAWRPYFERLRRDDPVHYTADSPFGPYWSVTTHRHILEVESHPEVFSSFPTIAIGDSPNDGSSIIRSLGFDIMARPMASICCSPPDKVPPSWSIRDSKTGNVENVRCMDRSTSARSLLWYAPMTRFS